MPVVVEIKWDGDKFLRRITDQVIDGVERATESVEETVRELVSRPNPDGSNPSLPGEPPKRVTGELYRSIGSTVQIGQNQVSGLVYAGTPYARRLEFGFVGVDSRGRRYNQAPRPFLRPALAQNHKLIMTAIRG